MKKYMINGSICLVFGAMFSTLSGSEAQATYKATSLEEVARRYGVTLNARPQKRKAAKSAFSPTVEVQNLSPPSPLLPAGSSPLPPSSDWSLPPSASQALLQEQKRQGIINLSNSVTIRPRVIEDKNPLKNNRLLCHVLKFADLKDLVRCAAANKAFNTAVAGKPAEDLCINLSGPDFYRSLKYYKLDRIRHLVIALFDPTEWIHPAPPITQTFTSLLNQVPNLESLQLDYGFQLQLDHPADFLGSLENCKKLKSFKWKYYGDFFSETGDLSYFGSPLDVLKSAPYIEELNIDLGYVSKGNAKHEEQLLKFLSDLPNLRSLTLSSAYFPWIALKLLNNMTALEHLGIPQISFNLEGLRSLTALKHLRHLDISGNQKLSETPVCAQLAELTELRVLDASGTGINDVSLLELAALPNLVTLRLDENPISFQGLHQFLSKTKSRLEKVSIQKTSMDHSEARRLQSEFGMVIEFSPNQRVHNVPSRQLRYARDEPPVGSFTQLGD